MTEIIEYTVVQSDSAKHLVEVVNELIPLGWQPYNSGYSIPSDKYDDEAYYVQPMVKYQFSNTSEVDNHSVIPSKKEVLEAIESVTHFLQTMRPNGYFGMPPHKGYEGSLEHQSDHILNLNKLKEFIVLHKNEEEKQVK